MQSPKGWNNLNNRSKLLWLLGILNSSLAIDLIMPFRSVRHTPKIAVDDFPLPLHVDPNIIQVIEQILNEEIANSSSSINRYTVEHKIGESAIDSQLELLNHLVETSYGLSKLNNISLVSHGIIPGLTEQQAEQKHQTTLITGQVIDVSTGENQVNLFVSGLDDDIAEGWVSLPQELPAWALDGTIFEAELSKDVETFAELSRRPWSLRRFKHTPRPYLSIEELQNRLLLHLKDA
ncbi:MAG: hypothetical protein R2932_04590 [Caldilineaceae bacterium]